MADDFVNLHNHAETSVLDGYGTISEYIAETKRLNQTALGLTDHGNMHGIYELITSCNKNGIQPIPGCEFYVAPQNPDGAKAKRRIFYGSESQRKFDVSSGGAYLHLTGWAYNETGLRNLTNLSSISNREENTYYKGRIDLEMLAEHSEGLVVSTGCPSSEISTRFNLGQDDEAYAYAKQLIEIFGKDRLFVEVMNHNMTIDLEKNLLPKLYRLAKDLDLKLLATNDSHYARAEDCDPHAEMLCLQSNSYMDDKTYDEGGRRFAFNGSDYYLKDSEGMKLILPKQLHSGIVNTRIIAEMAQDLSLDYDSSLRPNPKGFTSDSERLSFYKQLLEEGFQHRYGNASKEIQKQAREKMQYELEVLYSSDFLPYMIMVDDFLRHSRETYSVKSKEKILASSNGPGRGSVGGSIHAYLLGISDVDPIRFGLIFERFMSPGRGAVYEIDLADGGSLKNLVASDKVKVKDKDGNELEKFVFQIEDTDLIYFE